MMRPLVGMLAVVLLVGWQQAFAQQRSSREPTTQEYARQFEKDLNEAENHDPSTRKIVRFFKSWVGLVIIAVVVVAVAVTLKVTVALLTRSSGTTDPEKLAMQDPWVRAQLARQKAAETSFPTDPTRPD
jgi:hypothetical protein